LVAHLSNLLKHGARAQVQVACTKDPECFNYDLRDRVGTRRRLKKRKGMSALAKNLGYAQLPGYLSDAMYYLEAIYMASDFCLTPPGDTPKRRGFLDAIMALCIPVVFTEHTREYPWFLSNEDLAAGTVLIDKHEFLGNNAAMSQKLRDLRPKVPRMRAALARVVTSLQWSYSDLGEEDHEAVGPDAWDIAMYRLAGHRLSTDDMR
jgi:Exostosin family